MVVGAAATVALIALYAVADTGSGLVDSLVSDSVVSVEVGSTSAVERDSVFDQVDSPDAWVELIAEAKG